MPYQPSNHRIIALNYSSLAIAYLCTDDWSAYASVFPKDKHAAVGKHTGLTNHIERFNLTVRQRVSRLVRSSLSFSKKFENLRCCYQILSFPIQLIQSSITCLALPYFNTHFMVS
jgi:IS1 family transposase